MLTRSARRLETTLVSYSRQRLPRPARYSTPTKRAQAPALAAAAAPPPPDYPAFMPAPPASAAAPPASPESLAAMENFLKRAPAYTVLPTPEPDQALQATAIGGLFFTDTETQDRLAVVDACLHNLQDVPRAKQVFDGLRATPASAQLLTSRLYNQLLVSYVRMAEERQPEHRSLWVEEVWRLFDAMLAGTENCRPDAGSFAIMLLAWLKFNPSSETPVQNVKMLDEKGLLEAIVREQVPLQHLFADRSFATNEEAEEVMRLLSRASIEANMAEVVRALGEVERLGKVDDALVGVPEALPVLKTAVDPETQEVKTFTPFNIDTLRRHLAQVSFARQVLPGDPAARQKLLEQSVLDVAEARRAHEDAQLDALGVATGRQSRKLQKYMWDWHLALRERLKDDVAAVVQEEKAAAGGRRRERISPFLVLLKADKLSLLTIMELIRLCGTGGVVDGMKSARALIAVGKAVEDAYHAELARKHDLPMPSAGRAEKTSQIFSSSGYGVLHKRRIAAAKAAEDMEDWSAEWSQILRVKVGSFLVDALMKVATVEVKATNKRTNEEETMQQQAFFHAYEYMKGHKLGVIKVHPIIAERLAQDPMFQTLQPRHLPMLVKPKPWLNHNVGGYLNSKTSAMRFKESREQQLYLAHAADKGHVELVFAGLDVLGSTPWIVNREVFDVVLEVWNSGQRLGKMPPAEYEEPEPEKPANFDKDQAERLVWMTRMKAHMQAKAANHSDRCSVNYKIEIARAFLGDQFFFPHNIDFRGRAYPIPPHLNHIGDDLSRGLLLFAEKRALGERGLRWLKIHLANLSGFDKGSFDERVAFVMNHLDDIYDSAANPLTGRGWWRKADDPWQCLATCKELKRALESEDPHAYLSNLPVHQDGTCNGLQHYAALGGDAQGARQVNLDVTDRPSDVYTYVADMVEREIELDIAKTDNKYAKMLKGRVARKVVKQTVMTTVYGVTFIGARDQIDKQLTARGDIAKEDCWGAASYLAKKVLNCIGDLFRGAKDIQMYLNFVARLISKSIPPERIQGVLEAQEAYVAAKQAEDEEREAARVEGREYKAPAKAKSEKLADVAKEQMTSVIWTTPLGLPVVQPYRKGKRKQVHTKLQTVFISDPNVQAGVNTMKQASAFPPNFIHSLDATHMMLTALECRSQGLTFASVHDSYWTHACSIDDMSLVIRDTFIALHQSDVLKRLDDEIRERYKGYKLPTTQARAPGFERALSAYRSSVLSSAAALKTQDAALAVAVDESGQEAGVLEAAALEDAAAAPVRDDALSAAVDALKAEVVDAAAASPEELTDVAADATVDLLDGAPVDGGAEDAHAGLLSTRFVDLVDILPPLPNKGDFDVSKIKNSQYFFS